MQGTTLGEGNMFDQPCVLSKTVVRWRRSEDDAQEEEMMGTSCFISYSFGVAELATRQRSEKAMVIESSVYTVDEEVLNSFHFQKCKVQSDDVHCNAKNIHI